jgi:hypothetical protein
MPLQNRVLPTGEIVAIPLRGRFMGNRGILHDATGTLGPARWRHRNWVCCTLSFKDRRRPVMAPGAYTELFFHDEAIALAAGHRPCAECRRADYTRFLAAWATAHGTRPSAPDLDRALHAARVDGSRAQVRHTAALPDLPEGTFILTKAGPALVRPYRLVPFTPSGYTAPIPGPTQGPVTVLTPAPVVAVIRAGYSPDLHPDALSPP